MADEIPKLQLRLNPARLASIIDSAVVAANEIVNFHFNALTDADLSQPSESSDVRFRIRGPKITSDERRSLHESWILAKAFQELLRAVRHSLEEAYVYVMLLTKQHRIKSSATLSEFLEPYERRASGLSFPKLLDAVNDKLNPKIDFSRAYISLQTARNCLEHRGGVVSKIETHGKDGFEVSVPRIKAYYLRNGAEIELVPGHRVDPGDNRTEVQTFAKIELKKRSFALGERLSFSAVEFNEIAFACHFLGQQLSSRLPKSDARTVDQEHKTSSN